MINHKNGKSQLRDTVYYENSSKVVADFDRESNKDILLITVRKFYPMSDKIMSKEIGIIPQGKDSYSKEQEYYANGNLMHEAIYRNQVIDSIETYWYENGQQSKIISWQNGVVDSSRTNWFTKDVYHTFKRFNYRGDYNEISQLFEIIYRDERKLITHDTIY
jgi:antitoxin component YwqK of YwqJK toxin-antitoxin module